MNTLLYLDVEALPAKLSLAQPLSDEAFEAFCLKSDNVQIERTKEGEIVMHSPTRVDTTQGNSEINRQLRNWWTTHRRGKVFESNAGFFLNDTSMLCPDACYLLPETVARFGARGAAQIPHVCPDFVLELLSQSDSLREAQEKMVNWVANGASLGWLIDPYKRRVEVYRPGAEAVVISGDSIDGIGPADGFVLDLAEIWRCYEN